MGGSQRQEIDAERKKKNVHGPLCQSPVKETRRFELTESGRNQNSAPVALSVERLTARYE